ncbi:MAG TPA: NapC/NirT family cytochrome c [Thermoanaerobaculia bacterium]|nr:NapC/NirT family cytochrome c [Thermoanaerobaculia bacterium]
MSYLELGLAVMTLVTIALVVMTVQRPDLTDARGGKLLAFLAFVVLTFVTSAMGFSTHMEHSKTTDFCLSCHTMKPFGQSLRVDNSSWVPAQHFQNNRVPRDRACFTCHTSYTMFGDTQAKLRGLKHLWVYYFGTIPGKIALYEPYLNRECLHCHAGARSFEESDLHKEIRADLTSNATSCLECHDTIHDEAPLAEQPMWTESQP